MRRVVIGRWLPLDAHGLRLRGHALCHLANKPQVVRSYRGLCWHSALAPGAWHVLLGGHNALRWSVGVGVVVNSLSLLAAHSLGPGFCSCLLALLMPAGFWPSKRQQVCLLFVFL
jgi:hypothetical protein